MCMYLANRAYVCSCSVHLIVCCVHCYAVRLIIGFVDVNKTYLILSYKRGLCRHVVSVCLCVCDTFMSCVKTNKHIIKLFHHRVATPF